MRHRRFYCFAWRTAHWFEVRTSTRSASREACKADAAAALERAAAAQARSAVVGVARLGGGSRGRRAAATRSPRQCGMAAQRARDRGEVGRHQRGRARRGGVGGRRQDGRRPPHLQRPRLSRCAGRPGAPVVDDRAAMRAARMWIRRTLLTDNGPRPTSHVGLARWGFRICCSRRPRSLACGAGAGRRGCRTRRRRPAPRQHHRQHPDPCAAATGACRAG